MYGLWLFVPFLCAHIGHESKAVVSFETYVFRVVLLSRVPNKIFKCATEKMLIE